MILYEPCVVVPTTLETRELVVFSFAFIQHLQTLCGPTYK